MEFILNFILKKSANSWHKNGIDLIEFNSINLFIKAICAPYPLKEASLIQYAREKLH